MAKRPSRTKPKRIRTPRGLASLSPTEAATTLSIDGQPAVNTAKLQADRRAGAPANKDGTIHLVHYAAWLVAHGEDTRGA